MSDQLYVIDHRDIDVAKAAQLVRTAQGVKDWAYLCRKTKRVRFHKLGEDVHGIGRKDFEGLLDLQNAVFGEGVRLWLMIHEKNADETLQARVHELRRALHSCICAPCRKGDYANCYNEKGGMVYFPVRLFKHFAQFIDDQVIQESTEQLSLF